MLKKIGLKDVPILKEGEESLGLSDYALSLSAFVQKCETPITISIQGDWGSGKTSFMNLIKNDINEKDIRIKTVWFNTWQYSQFNLQSYLAISLISYFSKELGEKNNGGVSKVLNSLSKIGKAGVITVASAMGQGDSVKEGISSLEQGSEIDAAMQVKELKDELDRLVKGNIGEGPREYERIVVFIDDLDRLIPEKAVEFLEVFKLFLDLEDCVFIMACDYNVVMQGLKQKFGVDQQTLKGKSFFDKIIQLPFSMPVGLGDRKNYIGKLLDKIEAKYEEDDLADYEELVEKSVGFNPRNMKRIFNSLLLLNLVAERRKLYEEFKEKGDLATEPEKQKILFAILCMQIAYEPVYKLFIKKKNYISDDFFDAFINYQDILSTNEAENEDEDFSFLFDIYKELNDDKDFTKMKSLSFFMRIFYDCLHLRTVGDKEQLLPGEIDMLQSILSFSSITSIESTDASEDKVSDKMNNYQEYFTKFVEDLNQKGLKTSRKAKPKNNYTVSGGKHRTYYSFIFYKNNRCGVEVSIESEKEKSKKIFDVLLKNKDEIEREIGEKLSWERSDDKRFSRIAIYRDGSINDDTQKLDEIREWGVIKFIIFNNVFRKYIYDIEL